MNTVIGIIVALLIAGFIFWALRLIIGLIPLEPLFANIINVLLLILVVAIVLFWVVIPLLNLLGGVHIPVPSFR